MYAFSERPSAAASSLSLVCRCGASRNGVIARSLITCDITMLSVRCQSAIASPCCESSGDLLPVRQAQRGGQTRRGRRSVPPCTFLGRPSLAGCAQFRAAACSAPLRTSAADALPSGLWFGEASSSLGAFRIRPAPAGRPGHRPDAEPAAQSRSSYVTGSELSRCRQGQRCSQA